MAKLFAPQPPTLVQMIAAAERELSVRRAVYGRRVADGKMPQHKADHEIACMEGIIALLRAQQS